MGDPVGVSGVAELDDRNKCSKYIISCVTFTVTVVATCCVLQSYLKGGLSSCDRWSMFC